MPPSQLSEPGLTRIQHDHYTYVFRYINSKETEMSVHAPFWIVVSDEGPATPPHQHTTYGSAYAESIRLAKLHPELEFGVYQYVGHASATKPAKKTKWFFLYKDTGRRSALYDTEEKARLASLDSQNKVAESVLGGPCSIEVDNTDEPAATFYYFEPLRPALFTKWDDYNSF